MEYLFDKEDINSALNALRQGQLILYPTDTVWGLGCDATSEAAVEKIYSLKQRDDRRSMLVLVDSSDMLFDYVEQVPEIAFDLLEVADKPLTVIYPGARGFAPNLTAPDKTIGIRVVNDAFCRRLIRMLGKPLVSTSANISGEPFPEHFAKIDRRIVQGVDYVVKWRQDDQRAATPSAIIRLGVNGEVEVIRK